MVICVLLASEICLYREGLRRMLQEAEGIALVGIAASAEEAVDQACKLAPAVVLLDMGMAESFSATQHFATACKTSRVVVLGFPEAGAHAVAWSHAGVLGFVTRDGSISDLLDAIRAAARGEVCCSPRFVSRYAAALAAGRPNIGLIGLTARELQIFRLVQQGLSNKMISRRLGIGLSTVKNHVHSILAKLGVHRRAEAISLHYQHENPVSRRPTELFAERLVSIPERITTQGFGQGSTAHG
jgi:DNA-binding NarL/FixJ family response regulator